MRSTTVVRRLLGVMSLFINSVNFESRGLVARVRPQWRKPRCGLCGRPAPRYDRLPGRRWRHLNHGRERIWLVYAPRRVECPTCGIHTEQVPWAPHGSRFTWDFEELVAYMAQVSDRTSVTKFMGIAWRTAGAIVERVVARKLDPERLDNLRNIGADEFSYRRRHRYITTVVDHDRKRVVWAAKNRTSDTLEAFFDELGEERCAKIECATIDMSTSYIKAIEARLPNAQIVYDRFHVQRLASDALDEVRRAQLREIRGTDEGRELFGSRFALLKSKWNLTRMEKEKLKDLQRTNARIYRAYLLKESLAKALDYLQPWRAERALRKWLAWASRSRLKPFVKVARTIRKHLDGILAYFQARLTNGRVEGINNRLRMIARRAFGFHSAEALISMLFLCNGGITLDPALP